MSIDGRITPRQLMWLVVTVKTALVLVGIASIRAGVGRNAWMSELVGAALMVIPAWVVITLAKRFPKRTIVEIAQLVLGKYVGNVVAVLTLLSFLFVAAVLTREMGDFMTSIFFPNSHIPVFLILLTAVNAYGVRMGLETIVRTNDIFFLIVMLFFGFAWLVVSFEADYSHLYPIYVESGLGLIFKGGIAVAGSFLMILGVGMIFPYVAQQQRVFPSVVLGIFISGIIMTISVLVITAVLGPHQSNVINFHGLAASRTITIGGFIERLDTIFMAVWLMSTFVKISFFYYCLVLGMGKLFQMEAVNTLIVPSGALIVALGMALFDSYTQLIFFFTKGWIVHNWIFIFFLPLTLLLMAIVRKKKEV